ncbi:subclass B1 metallo-beta-lactamase [Spirosoma panaciterrae]|uniref:subclass B1 metallo-beta-lactamase n=1 Tax=Spirosoma panaciterrae TaxID=496058 RepID=UPI000375FAF8|nr:subclass B1 metallo-beta-lactamase [Spirosoma panaciterrae]
MRFLVFFLATLLTHLSLAQSIQKPKLKVIPLNDKVYVHITYGLYQNEPVPSNGLIIKTKDGVVLVDTGWDTDSIADNTQQLLQWVKENLHQPVRLCIATHAHGDRVGGTGALQRAGVRVVSTPLTAKLSIKEGYPSPEGILPSDTTFTIGGEPIRCYFPGEGHTSDNIVVYLPNQRILHGGCLVKSVAAFGMGYLGDANLAEWANSIRNVQAQFGKARIIVPGHDEWSDPKALDHTLNLLAKHLAKKK